MRLRGVRLHVNGPPAAPFVDAKHVEDDLRDNRTPGAIRRTDQSFAPRDKRFLQIQIKYRVQGMALARSDLHACARSVLGE